MMRRIAGPGRLVLAAGVMLPAACAWRIPPKSDCTIGRLTVAAAMVTTSRREESFGLRMVSLARRSGA